MDKLKKTVAQLEETVDVVDRCIAEVQYEASLNNLKPEYLVGSDGKSKLAGLVQTKATVLTKLLEVYVWIEEEEKARKMEEDAGILAREINAQIDAILDNKTFIDNSYSVNVEMGMPPKPKRHVLSKGWLGVIRDAKLRLPLVAPVTFDARTYESPVGQASQFRRHLNGDVSAVIKWHDPENPIDTENGWDLGMVIDDAKWADRKTMKLESGRIQAVTFMPRWNLGIPKDFLS